MEEKEITATLPAGEPAVIKRNLQLIARRLGFDACRVASAREAKHADLFKQWVEAGSHGDMTWLSRRVERRCDPRLVLPGAESVIVLAVNYFQGDCPDASRHRGTFARYAWGSDYHDLVEEKLKDLAAYIEDVGGRHRYYVDTGPVLERDFASESGLGWNGKSTVQIHPKLGTWFFLATILTTLRLPPDAPMKDRCGSCTRCIDVCPTKAITAERRLEARRCLSYLTIEHRGPIPTAYRRALGDRIYGCDDCLEVCPWNRFAGVSQEASLHAREFVRDWDLRDFLALDDEGFRALFRKSPVKRTKREGFLRNVCVALGNVGNREDLPALRRAAREESELVAEHARWAIAEIEARECA